MEYASPRFACKVVDDVVIAVHTKENPTDEDWDRYGDVANGVMNVHGSVKMLVYSIGGGPNSLQRNKANEAFRDRPQQVAVMLNSAMTRGIVTALSWFNPAIKAFNLEQLEEACTYLGVPRGQLDPVREALEVLKTRLGI
ncbi:SpoIIAA family protein [Paraliomyxa miuraensis]|uniref:STAS/SEC14 domain-containing protein n=1 Tax=Paraliomyxa miuraensis TaxID=376150 RepID=UPI0022589678|nr:STAS/SEC14 domain-containing protein [Paraliomyxa miuraensis]MCX4240264.1 STAS/SEC14 domain-containing protein [Paraliomyxa miuraensis]